MYNSNVVKHTPRLTGKVTPEMLASPAVLARRNINKQVTLENSHAIADKFSDHERKQKMDQQTHARLSAQLLESKIPVVMNNLTVQGKEIVYKQVMFEMFKQSLYLDEKDIYENAEALYEVLSNHLDELGGFTYLVETAKRTSSPVLSRLVKVCNEMTSKVVNRKLLEAKSLTSAEELELFQFDINDDEKKELDYCKSDIDVDAISDLVKNKVLTVIRDEKTRQQRENELTKDIEEAAAQAEITTEAAFSKYITRGNSVNESTLFNALMQKSYKVALTEGGAGARDASHQRANDMRSELNHNVNYDMSDLAVSDHIDVTAKDETKGEYTLPEEIDGYRNEIDLELKDGLQIDMDLVLAEALTNYTLFEMCHTIKLKEFSGKEIRQISHNLIYN